MEELIIKLEKVKKDNDMDNMGFICVGTAIEVLGVTNEDPEVYVWQKADGTQVTMYDEGDCKCSFIAIIREPKEKKGKTAMNGRPKDLALV